MSDLRKAAEYAMKYPHGPSIGIKSQALAQSYLAEHPGDGDEPITEEWIDAVVDGDEWTYTFGSLESQVFNRLRRDMKTRGDFRRAAHVFGLELKEGGR